MDFREYVEQNGWRTEVVTDHGIRTGGPHNDAWEHHAYTVRLINGDGVAMVTPWMQGVGITADPTEQTAEIADSLVSDVWSYRQRDNFEDWAEDFGYDTDSRAAEKIYNAIGALADAVVALFDGREQFEYVATEIDRL